MLRTDRACMNVEYQQQSSYKNIRCDQMINVKKKMKRRGGEEEEDDANDNEEETE